MGTYALLLGKNNKIIPIFQKEFQQKAQSAPLQNKTPESYGGVFPKHCLRVIEVVDNRGRAIQRNNLARRWLSMKRFLCRFRLLFPLCNTISCRAVLRFAPNYKDTALIVGGSDDLGNSHIYLQMPIPPFFQLRRLASVTSFSKPQLPHLWNVSNSLINLNR